MNKRELWIQASQDMQAKIFDLITARFDELCKLHMIGEEPARPPTQDELEAEAIRVLCQTGEWVRNSPPVPITYIDSLGRGLDPYGSTVSRVIIPKCVPAKAVNRVIVIDDADPTTTLAWPTQAMSTAIWQSPPGGRIAAIKEVRNKFPLGLREAKELVDSVTNPSMQ